MTNIPITAWEQAAIVGLFIVFVVALFTFVRWLLNWVRRVQTEAQEAYKDSQNEWQNFVHDRDIEWRDFFTKLNEKACLETDKMQDLVRLIAKLTEKNVSLVESVLEQLRLHDEKVDSRIDEAVKRVSIKD